MNNWIKPKNIFSFKTETFVQFFHIWTTELNQKTSWFQYFKYFFSSSFWRTKMKSYQWHNNNNWGQMTYSSSYMWIYSNTNNDLFPFLYAKNLFILKCTPWHLYLYYLSCSLHLSIADLFIIQVKFASSGDNVRHVGWIMELQDYRDYPQKQNSSWWEIFPLEILSPADQNTAQKLSHNGRG